MNIYESIQNAIQVCASQFPSEMLSVLLQNPIQIPLGLLGVAFGCYLLMPRVSDREWYEMKLSQVQNDLMSIGALVEPNPFQLSEYRKLRLKERDLLKSIAFIDNLLNQSKVKDEVGK
jgi:hypothetical protein